MVTEEQLQEIVRRIVAGYAPDRIILFGSYAYGTPTEDSDVDLLVIKADDTADKLTRTLQVRRAARGRHNPALDVLVINAAELIRIKKNKFVVEHIALRDGRELYATL